MTVAFVYYYTAKSETFAELGSIMTIALRWSPDLEAL